jgi:sulfatase maturation enzyme AslB (radical SAM superfamily)
LKKLSVDKSTRIREKLASKFIETSTKDPDWRVRYIAINDNPEVPIKILEELIHDKDTRVQNKAKELLYIQKNYIYRKDFDNAITIKLVIPGACNANCSFCYNKHGNQVEKATISLKQNWLDNFLIALEQVVAKIGKKQPISIDITGNEPTLDADFFIKVMHKLRGFSLKNNISRITCTTNGINIKKVAPYMNGIVNYVNISVHDYDQERRNKIFGSYYPTDEDYKENVKILLDNNINCSAVSVIDGKIENFCNFRDNFIKWAEDIGFVSLRFRYNVYSNNSDNFLDYMNQTVSNDQFFTIQKEDTPDSNWCQLTKSNGFMVFFLKGVIDTYEVSPGIEFIIHDDGKAYADFGRAIPFEKYPFPVGYVFDKK